MKANGRKPGVQRAILILLTFLTCLGYLSSAGASQPPRKMSPATFDQLRFLLGDWVGGEVKTGPGQGRGSFAFSLDLQGAIMIRRNQVDYVATKDKPAFSHDDLMIIYHGQGNATRAIYFDNEGHFIHYEVEISQDQREIVLLGDLSPSSPRFRFTYLKAADDRVDLKFEIAPPGQPEAFSLYIESTATRKK